MQEFPGHEISFSFNFDAMNTGQQASGRWRTQAHLQWKTFMRALVHILHQRHSGRHLLWNHIKAHTNHPFNEFADRLAKFAATYPGDLGDCEPWHTWLNDSTVMSGFQWIWFLERSQRHVHDMPEFDGPFLRHKILVPKHSGLPVEPSHHKTQEYRTDEIAFVIATANVLTLAEGKQLHPPQLTRQRILQRQFHEARCTVVCLQETRHSRLIDRNNDLYHVIGHPAHDGRDGIQVWISKQHSWYQGGAPATMKNLTLIDSGSSHMILKIQFPRWRCILITGRAPHSGRPEHECQDFWNAISAKIRPFWHSWPIFFAGDTNGHVGSVNTASIGPYGATQENCSGMHLHRRLLEYRLFLPCTFEQHHRGDLHTTFTSHNGQHETRIDYVAVPRDLAYNKLVSWVNDH